jgi:hypothetical protein
MSSLENNVSDIEEHPNIKIYKKTLAYDRAYRKNKILKIHLIMLAIIISAILLIYTIFQVLSFITTGITQMDKQIFNCARAFGICGILYVILNLIAKSIEMLLIFLTQPSKEDIRGILQTIPENFLNMIHRVRLKNLWTDKLLDYYLAMIAIFYVTIPTMLILLIISVFVAGIAGSFGGIILIVFIFGLLNFLIITYLALLLTYSRPPLATENKTGGRRRNNIYKTKYQKYKKIYKSF